MPRSNLIACGAWIVALAQVAHADVLSLVLDGDAPSAAGAVPTDPDELIAWAGEPTPITLPELLQSAIAQAPALQNATLDVAIAVAQIAETWKRRDWTITAQSTADYAGASYSSGIPISGSIVAGGSADIARTLPTGATFDLRVSSQYNDTGVDIPGFTSGAYWNDAVTGSITQPLLKGAGAKFYNAPERKADLSRDVAVLARRLTALQTVQTVISDYWDLVLAEHQVAIAEASLAMANERLRVTQIEVDTGKSAPSEIPAVEQTIATTGEQVVIGQLAVLDASLALRRAVGMPIGPGQLGLRVATDLDAPDVALDIAALTQRAFDASPQLAELAKQDASAGIDIYVNDNGLLPQLDLALTVGPNVSDFTFGPTAKELAQVKAYEIGGSITFSRAVHQYDVRYHSSELRQMRQKIRVNASDVRLQLAQAMSHAVGAMHLAKRRIALDARAVALAKQNIRIETDRYSVGRSTNFDVMLRLDQERAAELTVVQAQIDWHKAWAMMLMLTGDLLPTYGIALR